MYLSEWVPSLDTSDSIITTARCEKEEAKEKACHEKEDNEAKARREK